jgi:hypothetical protein
MDACGNATEGHSDDALVFVRTGIVFVQNGIGRTAQHKKLFGEPRAMLVRR